MEVLLQVGGGAAALLAIIALAKIMADAHVRGIRRIFKEELAGVWSDMDDIENRLSAVEISLQYVREQLEALRLYIEEVREE